MATASEDMVSSFILCMDQLLKGAHSDPWQFLAEEAVIEVIGTTPISGVYRGRQEIVSLLVATAMGRIACGSVTVLDSLGEGQDVGVFVLLKLTTPEGRIYNAQGDPAGCWFGTSNGKIIEIRCFPDTTQVETQLFGYGFVPNPPRAANGTHMRGAT